MRTNLHYDEMAERTLGLRARQAVATVLWLPMLLFIVPQVLLTIVKWCGALAATAEERLDRTRFYRWFEIEVVDRFGTRIENWVWRKR